MLEELRGDVQATLGELRELAHGIYPPLLRDRGLAEALRTAANRAVLPTEVIAEGIERYPSETEAAVYFCCLEAMQNAGKHAGKDASITVTITGRRTSTSTSAWRTPAPGFDATVAVEGHGFVNMRDRLGAVGGTLTVDSDAEPAPASAATSRSTPALDRSGRVRRGRRRRRAQRARRRGHAGARGLEGARGRGQVRARAAARARPS